MEDNDDCTDDGSLENPFLSSDDDSYSVTGEVSMETQASSSGKICETDIIEAMSQTDETTLKDISEVPAMNDAGLVPSQSLEICETDILEAMSQTDETTMKDISEVPAMNDAGLVPAQSQQVVEMDTGHISDSQDESDGSAILPFSNVISRRASVKISNNTLSVQKSKDLGYPLPPQEEGCCSPPKTRCTEKASADVQDNNYFGKGSSSKRFLDQLTFCGLLKKTPGLVAPRSGCQFDSKTLTPPETISTISSQNCLDPAQTCQSVPETLRPPGIAILSQRSLDPAQRCQSGPETLTPPGTAISSQKSLDPAQRIQFGPVSDLPPETVISPQRSLDPAQRCQFGLETVTPLGRAMLSQEFLDPAQRCHFGPEIVTPPGTAISSQKSLDSTQRCQLGPETEAAISSQECLDPAQRCQLGPETETAISSQECLDPAQRCQFGPEIVTEPGTAISSLKSLDPAQRCQNGPVSDLPPETVISSQRSLDQAQRCQFGPETVPPPGTAISSQECFDPAQRSQLSLETGLDPAQRCQFGPETVTPPGTAISSQECLDPAHKCQSGPETVTPPGTAISSQECLDHKHQFRPAHRMKGILTSLTPELSIQVYSTDVVIASDTESDGSVSYPVSTPKTTKASGKKKYKRRRRLCPYCKKLQTRLSRHLLRHHYDEKDVKSAIHLDEEGKRKAFAHIRNKGLLLQNSEKAGKCDLEKIKNDKTRGKIVTCSICKGTYASRYFSRHRKHCEEGRPQLCYNVPNASPEFHDLLRRFQDNEVGNLCREDKTIIMIGHHLYYKEKSKVNKKDETRKCVMSDMRLLARLYIELRQHTQLDEKCDAEQLFYVKNFKNLTNAIGVLSAKDDEVTESDIKYGLKNTIYHLLCKAGPILENEALLIEDETKAKKFEKFVKVLKHHENIYFSDAKYFINQARQERLRLPSRLPAEESVIELRSYMLKQLQTLTSSEEINRSEFIELRNLACSRITLFNARRGGEPARTTLAHWTGREKWMSHQSSDTETELKLFKTLEIYYIPGKGNKLVSTMVPKDTIPALKILSNAETRQNIGVSVSNRYLFPQTGNSLSHVCGWNATNDVLQRAALTCPEINATNFRARISTLYAGLELSPHNRELFYKHMGHTKDVNEGTYQRPLAEMTLERVGDVLQSIDEGAQHIHDDDEGKQNIHDDEGILNNHDDEGVQTSHDDEGVQTSHDDEGVHNSHDDEGVQNSHDDEGVQNSHDDEGVQNSHDDEGVQNSHDDEGVQNSHDDNEGMQNIHDDNEGMQNNAPKAALEETHDRHLLRSKSAALKVAGCADDLDEADDSSDEYQPCFDDDSTSENEFEDLVKASQGKKSDRYRWTTEQTQVIHKYFKRWIRLPPPTSNLPGKKEVLHRIKGTFLQDLPYFKIRTKVYNEQKKAQKQLKLKLNIV